MTSGREVCDRHDPCMERIHDKIDSIKSSVDRQSALMEGFVNRATSDITKIQDDFYKPQTGLSSRLSSVTAHTRSQWYILGCLITGLIGIGFWLWKGK